MANTSMQNMKLPGEIQNEIIDYMMRTQNNLENQQELETFYMMLKPSIRELVTKHIFLGQFNSNPLFSKN